MPDRVLHDATQMSGGAAAASGLLTFLSENPQLVGLAFTGISVLAMIIFGILNYRLNKRRLLVAIESAGKSEQRLTDEELATVKKILGRNKR